MIELLAKGGAIPAALKNLGKPSKTPRYKFLKHSFLVLTLPGGYAQG